MKKFGQFCFCFLPFLLVTGIQYLVFFFGMGISGLIESTWYTAYGSADILQVFNDLMYLWTTERFNTYVMVSYAIVTTIVFGLWYYAGYGGDFTPAPRRIFHPLSIVGICMLVPGMQYLTVYIVNFAANLVPHWLDVYENLMESAGLDERLTFGMFLYGVLLAPICEELVFRGVMQRQAKKCLPFWAVNLLQAILFGIFHMNMIQGLYTFFVGLIFGYVCEKSNSIYNAILLHMLFNFWGTVLSRFAPFGDTIFAFLFWFLFGIAMTVGGLFVFNAGAKKISSKK